MGEALNLSSDRLLNDDDDDDVHVLPADGPFLPKHVVSRVIMIIN